MGKATLEQLLRESRRLRRALAEADGQQAAQEDRMAAARALSKHLKKVEDTLVRLRASLASKYRIGSETTAHGRAAEFDPWVVAMRLEGEISDAVNRLDDIAKGAHE